MMEETLKNKNVLVLGLGLSGRSAARFLMNKGAKVTGVDRDYALLESNGDIISLRGMGLKAIHESEKIELSQFNLFVVSPGISTENFYYREALKNGKEVIGEIELACRYIHQPFLGITGTNGKTTVSLLVGHVLNVNTFPARVVGNVGIPLTRELMSSKEEILVCELSSYQLETLHSKIIDVGVVLNITPDHLDRYASMNDYAAAKLNIAKCMKPNGKLFIEKGCYASFQEMIQENNSIKTYGYTPDCDLYTDLHKIYYKENLEFILPVQYRGKASHDLENVMAAYAMCREMGVGPNLFIHALSTFKKPSHRIEFVRKINGVSYFNDSKGTNIDAVIRAVQAMNGKVVLIAGGLDKGSSYEPWISAFADKVKAVCVIGQAKEKINEELSPKISVVKCQSLEEAVNISTSLAKEGENVLLSPGCASFDMFRDYAHRGDEFKRIIDLLHH